MIPFRWALCLLIAWLGLGSAALAQNDRVIIQVVNGRTGKLLAKQRLLLFVGGSPEAVRQHYNHYELFTDKVGQAGLILEPQMQRLQVWVDFHILCQKEPNFRSFSVATIMSTGLSTPNSCGSVSKKAKPGRLVVFARPATFWEKMRR